jgi:hypothetical protein
MTPPVATRIVEAMKAPLTAQGPPGGTGVAANYEIRVKGRVSDAALLAFEGLTVTTEPAETILYGPIPDQEALDELLGKLHSHGLEVVEFRRLPAPDPRQEPPA